MYKIWGKEDVMVKVPGLTQAGEVFNLVGEEFASGTTGRVYKVISQSGGVTQVVMKIVKGRITPIKRRDPEPEPEATPSSAPDNFDKLGQDLLSEGMPQAKAKEPQSEINDQLSRFITIRKKDD